MRRVFLLLAGVLLLTACETEDNYNNYNGGRGNGGYGSNSGNYYGNDNDRYGYGSYYPYGQRNYPRDRIFMIDNNHRCTQGRIYQGYCYHHDDDYRRAVDWDRSHGYDNNWHNHRKEWCNSHDCRRDHDDGNRDAREHQQRPVEHDRQAPPHPQNQNRNWHQNQNDPHKPTKEDAYHEPAGSVRSTPPQMQHDNRQHDNGRHDNGRWHQSPEVNTEAQPANSRYRQSSDRNQSPGRNQSSPGEQQDYGTSGRSQSPGKRESSDGAGQEQRSNNNGKHSRHKRGDDAQSSDASPDGQ